MSDERGPRPVPDVVPPESPPEGDGERRGDAGAVARRATGSHPGGATSGPGAAAAAAALHPDGRPLRVVVVAEFYPRAEDPVLGVWAHRQAVAARAAGAEVEVLVLHRPVPPRATRPRDAPAVAWRMLRQPRREIRDGVPVTYVRFLSPPREGSYGRWGRFAARPLRRALRRLARRFDYDVVHAHNAVPAGDALRLRPTRGDRRRGTPLVVSVHGGDVYFTALRSDDGAAAVEAAFAAATLVVANSAGTAERCVAAGAAPGRTRVVRLGTDVPDAAPERTPASAGRAARRGRPGPGALGGTDDVEAPTGALGGDVDHHDWRGYGRSEVEGERARDRRRALRRSPRPTAVRPRPRRPSRDAGDGLRAPVLVTVGHLVPRKRHADVVRAVWLLRDAHPELRYRIVGDGPERAELERLAARLGIADRVELLGQRRHEEAVRLAHEADLFAMPSVDEAFGVAYVEAMGGGVPAIGALGEPGPTEIAEAGLGMVLVPPADPTALAAALDGLLGNPEHREELGREARRTVLRAFTWDVCGRETVATYRRAVELAGASERG